MATLFVDKVDPQSGTSLEIGSSGDTITTATGAKPSFLYPAFQAYLSSNQDISDATATKVQFNTEIFDSNSTYDNSTNYRFTPAVAGKYSIYSQITLETTGGHELDLGVIYIYVNGSTYAYSVLNPSSSSMFSATLVINQILDLSATDYVEIFGYLDRTSGGTIRILGDSNKQTSFNAYRIGT
jgi:hypothetical protein